MGKPKKNKNRARSAGSKQGSKQGSKRAKQPGQKQAHKQSHHAASAAATPAPAGRSGTVSTGVVAFGVVLLVVAVGASLMLVLEAVGRLDLPGCGPEAGCGKAAASVWGKVPGLGWPTSHVGLAYFLGVLVAWLMAGGRASTSFRWLLRLGALGSIVLTGAMLVGGYICWYCMMIHLANLAFVALVEFGTPRLDRAKAWATTWRPVGVTGAAFLVATAGLWVLQRGAEAAADEKQETQLAESTERIIQGSTPSNPAGTAEIDPVTPVASERGFVGRYVQGPEVAPIRIVIVSDYQCPDCNRIHDELQPILASRDDVSFSHKHFPFCIDCNKKAREHNLNLHPNACWAARAAETAGILRGNAGFWQMHDWLFDRDGSFTDVQIQEGLAEMGYDASEFLSVMQGPQTLALVEEDVDEAIDLGLRQTPMIFINGVELSGWRARNAIGRAVEQLAATNPEPKPAGADQPPLAFEKYMNDWRGQPVRAIPPDGADWGHGPEDAPGQIVMWGDYQEPYTAELDRRVRAKAMNDPRVRYSFRHYPINQSCNPDAERTMHPNACLMSQAAEAAGRLGGVDAYWAMHAWLMDNQRTFSVQSLRSAAASLGHDPDTLFREMNSPEVAAAIAEDAAAAKRLFLRGVPFMFANGKQVPFWRLEGEALPEAMIEEVASGGQE